MKLTILQIENRIVNCQLDDGTIIDIAQRWFTKDIQEGDVIDFDMDDVCNVNEGVWCAGIRE
ncbi:MAG: hypothetical protein HFI55_14975 [Lachnospiraceae bacterium]|jgi:hypothetical protein|nr:hypothetical protein [Lachnospiraceae bacterium]